METSKPSFDAARHRRGGRPPKPDNERRAIDVHFRLSPEERERAKATIATTGLTLSEFVRQAFEGSVEIVTSQQAAPELLRQLRVLNDQMNQILHEARRAPEALPQLEKAAIDAMQTVNAELRVLIHGPQP